MYPYQRVCLPFGDRKHQQDLASASLFFRPLLVLLPPSRPLASHLSLLGFGLEFMRTLSRLKLKIIFQCSHFLFPNCYIQSEYTMYFYFHDLVLLIHTTQIIGTIVDSTIYNIHEIAFVFLFEILLKKENHT